MTTTPAANPEIVMTTSTLIAIEMALILTGMVTFALWEIRAVRRSRKG